VAATPAWASRFGPPVWPRRLDACTFPFIAALDVPGMSSVMMRDLNGSSVEVSMDACRTPYHSFLLLWVPAHRRLLPFTQPHAVRLAQAGLTAGCRHYARYGPLLAGPLIHNQVADFTAPGTQIRRVFSLNDSGVRPVAGSGAPPPKRRTVPARTARMVNVRTESYLDERDASRGEQP
jgi:hypothetical protein